MVKWLTLFVVLSACTPSHVLEQDKSSSHDDMQHISLPIYQPLPPDAMMLNLGTGGQLRMVNGCVGLNYSDEDGIFDILLTFPEGTKTLNQGKSIQFFNQSDQIFHDGDFVIAGGNVPSLERPTRTLIPNHCHGKKYLAVSDMYLNHNR